MGKAMMTAAGVAAGVALAGTVGMLLSGGKIKPRRVAKKTAKAMNTVGDVMQNAARMTGKCC